MKKKTYLLGAIDGHKRFNDDHRIGVVEEGEDFNDRISQCIAEQYDCDVEITKVSSDEASEHVEDLESFYVEATISQDGDDDYVGKFVLTRIWIY